jgi:hypothetical protein
MGWNFYNSSGELQINDGGVLATAASITNDLTVTSGNVVIATAGKGIDFSAQTQSTSYTAAAEVLNHYEEGSWTPAVQDNSRSDSESQTYTTQVGRYTRIGNRVFITGRMEVNSLGTLGTSDAAIIAGLPFTTLNATSYQPAIAVGRGDSLNLGTAGYVVSAHINANDSVISLNLWDGTAGTSPLTIAELSAGGGVYLEGSYQV